MRSPRLMYIGAFLATMAALVLGLSAAAPAGASSRPGKPAIVMKTLRQGMTIVPVVRILGPTAGKKGYFTVLAANGKEAFVPDFLKRLVELRMRQERRISPMDLKDTVYGDCGSSFIELGLKSSGYPIHMTTGFTVILPAVAYSWSGGISGPDYSYPYSASGALAFDSSWTGKHNSAANESHGIWSGAISTGSWADLDDGDICYSGGPAVSGHL